MRNMKIQNVCECGHFQKDHVDSYRYCVSDEGIGIKDECKCLRFRKAKVIPQKPEDKKP